MNERFSPPATPAGTRTDGDRSGAYDDRNGPSCRQMSLRRHTAEHLVSLREEELRRCAEALRTAIVGRARIFTLGNGGSATTASHLACDLAGRHRVLAGRRARVRCLYDLGMTTALANDHGYENVFCGPLEDDAERGDVVVAISVSGRSPNVLRALATARSRGVVTVGLLGTDGGEALRLSDAALLVPCDDFGVVESVHVAVVHELAAAAFAADEGTGGVLVTAGDGRGAPG